LKSVMLLFLLMLVALVGGVVVLFRVRCRWVMQCPIMAGEALPAATSMCACWQYDAVYTSGHLQDSSRCFCV
jgi:hypothetical protein